MIESLASFAERRGAVTVDEVADLLEQLCQSVSAIHAAGRTHQDLQPATIFLETPSSPGIAWSVRVSDPSLALAQRSSAAAGEPLWMAPEQADARPAITAAVDVWSLGLLAFYLLIGKSYWKGASAGSMLPAAVHQEVVFDPLVAASTRAAELGVLGRIPDGFDAWFARCVARLPSERFPDAGAVVEALRASWGSAARAALPNVPLGFEGMGGGGPPQGPPPQGPPYGSSPQGPTFPGAPQGYSYPQQGYGPPPQPTWGVVQPARGSSPLPWILGVLGLLMILVIGGGLGAAFYLSARPRPIAVPIVAAPSIQEKGSIWISPADPSWGSRTALVTIVEYSDFQCPFCKRVNVTLKTLKTQYDPETLRIVWKNNPLPFHKGARPAAIAAMTAFTLGGNDAFWRFHDHAFAGQDALVDESFASWALDTGVDMVKWRAAVASGESGTKIDSDIAIGKQAGVTGTPGFFINGVFLSGAQSLEKLVEIIEAQQTAARAAIAAGTPPEDVYARLSIENKVKTPLPKPTEPAAPKDETTVWRVPVALSPSRGPASAPVTIVEIGDFRCPFCKRAAATLTDVRARYGAKVRIVWKNNPLAFHARAEPAAEVAMAAFAEQGDAGFWQMHDLLYENQAHLEEADLLGYAKRLRFRSAAAALDDKTQATRIKADQELAKSLDATGTPTFFINGRRLTGAQSLERFAAIIDEELRHADELIARGVAPANVYAEIQKTAKAGK